MTEASPSLRQIVALLVLAVNICILGACSSGAGSTAMAPTLEPGNKGTPTNPITVDDPSCVATTVTCANEITGINDGRSIVGNYTHCKSNSTNPCSGANWNCSPSTRGTPCQPCPLLGGANQWHSYTSVYNSGYSSFTDIQFPDAPQGQYMYAISDAFITHGSLAHSIVGPSAPNESEVGCINPYAGSYSGNGEQNGYWALLDNNGLWSVHEQGNASGCKGTGTTGAKVFDETGELLGYDLNNATTPTAVGFYSAGNCTFTPGKIQAGSNWIPIHPHLGGSFSAKNAMATGITGSGTSTNSGDIVGVATQSGKTSSQATYEVAWYSKAPQTFYEWSSAAIATAFTGIATVGSSKTIVGWYTLPRTGGGTVTHGLIATPKSTAGQYTVTSPIDVGNGTLTMINGINSLGDICGWYADANGKYHGFVWLGKAATVLRGLHPHHLVTNYRNPQVRSVNVPVQPAYTVH